MRSSSIGLAVLALLVLAGPAMGSTIASEPTTEEVSTEEVTCEQAASCDAPSATARVTVQAPAAGEKDLDTTCAERALEARGPGPDCETTTPDVDPGMLRLYASVDGLTTGQDGSSSSQSAQAAAQGSSEEGLLSMDLETGLLLGALGIGASGAAAFVGLRRIAALLIAPLASRLKRSELLDDETRCALYEHIQANPGVNLRELADTLDLAWGTLLHHLRKLEKGHLVVSRRYGKYRRYFLNGSTYTKEEQARLAALSTPSTARVAEYILENPGTNQADIGEAIGVTASTILWHVRRLKDVDLVREEREGRYVHYFPALQDHEVEQVQQQVAAA